MSLYEIKTAVLGGLTVHWVNDGYRVFVDRLDRWLIIHERTGSIVGLTYLDGITLNGDEKDFYIGY